MKTVPGTVGFCPDIQGEVSKRGIIDVLRKGIKHELCHIGLSYGTPSPGIPSAPSVTPRTDSR